MLQSFLSIASFRSLWILPPLLISPVPVVLSPKLMYCPPVERFFFIQSPYQWSQRRFFPLQVSKLQFYFVILGKTWQPFTLTTSWISTQKLFHLLSTRCLRHYSIKDSSKTQEYKEIDGNKLEDVALDIDKLLTWITCNFYQYDRWRFDALKTG